MRFCVSLNCFPPRRTSCASPVQTCGAHRDGLGCVVAVWGPRSGENTAPDVLKLWAGAGAFTGPSVFAIQELRCRSGQPIRSSSSGIVSHDSPFARDLAVFLQFKVQFVM